MKKIAVLMFLSFPIVLFSYTSPLIDTENSGLESAFLENPAAFNLMESALIASGVSDYEMETYFNWLYELDREIKLTVSYTNEITTASEIFDFMHQSILGDYDENVTTLVEIYKKGDFNCLSSALLYNVLLELSGIDTRMAVTTDHAYSVVLAGGRQIDAETTTALGFDMENKEQAQKNLERLTGFSYDSEKEAEIVDELGMLGNTYANRAFYAFEEKDNEEALQLALKGYSLYAEGNNVVSNTAASILGYAYELFDDEEYGDVLNLLTEIITNFPQSDYYDDVYKSSLDNFIVQQIDEGNLTAAKNAFENSLLQSEDTESIYYGKLLYRKVMDEGNLDEAYDDAVTALQILPDDEYIHGVVYSAELEVYYRIEAEPLSYADDEESLLEWYELTATTSYADSGLELVTAAYFDAATAYYNAGDYEEALFLIDVGLGYDETSDYLLNQAANIAEGTAISFYNEGDYENAASYFHLGLDYLPADETMKGNLELTYKAWAGDLVNAEDWDEAILVINEGLSYFPENSKLIYYKDYYDRKVGK